MRILVVGSCGKSKLKTHPDAPTCSDIDSKDAISKWRKHLSSYLTPARELYTGFQSTELLRGVEILRAIDKVEVRLLILSAGFGLLEENEIVPPYECSFSQMSKSKIRERSAVLRIEEDYKKLHETRFDLTYLALGKKYLTALGNDFLSYTRGTVVVFDSKWTDEKAVYVPSGSKAVRAFSIHGFKIHGVVGFKGDLLRILAEHALGHDDQYGEVVAWTEPSYLEELVYSLGGLRASPP
ncbi:MAG: DUF6884 domain-containing protein [Candidatus Thorarchaeota archaeon]|jgi:hypothetical protein